MMSGGIVRTGRLDDCVKQRHLLLLRAAQFRDRIRRELRVKRGRAPLKLQHCRRVAGETGHHFQRTHRLQSLPQCIFMRAGLYGST